MRATITEIYAVDGTLTLSPPFGARRMRIHDAQGALLLDGPVIEELTREFLWGQALGTAQIRVEWEL